MKSPHKEGRGANNQGGTPNEKMERERGRERGGGEGERRG
jgi:hypothetical protein